MFEGSECFFEVKRKSADVRQKIPVRLETALTALERKIEFTVTSQLQQRDYNCAGLTALIDDIDADVAVGRRDGTATVLSNRQVMVIAGQTAGGIITNRVEFYDPTTGMFSFGPPLIQFRQSHTASLFNDGRVLVAGGFIVGTSLTSAELSP